MDVTGWLVVKEEEEEEEEEEDGRKALRIKPELKT